MSTEIETDERTNGDHKAQTISETVNDAVHGTDPPMEVAYPGTAPTLVFGVFPLLLIVSLIAAACYFGFYSGKTKYGELTQPPVELRSR